MGRLDQAGAEFRQVVSAVPQDAQAHNDLGEVLVRMGKPAAALEQFETALSLDPSLVNARRNRDQILQQPAGH